MPKIVEIVNYKRAPNFKLNPAKKRAVQPEPKEAEEDLQSTPIPVAVPVPEPEPEPEPVPVNDNGKCQSLLQNFQFLIFFMNLMIRENK